MPDLSEQMFKTMNVTMPVNGLKVVTDGKVVYERYENIVRRRGIKQMFDVDIKGKRDSK